MASSHEITATGHEGHEHHVLPMSVYLGVYGVLLVLTVITVLVSYADLGPLSLPVAMVVAMIKATTVAAFFMHLRYDNRFFTLIFGGSLLFIAIFFSFTLFDLSSRGEFVQAEKTFTAKQQGVATYKQNPIELEHHDHHAGSAMAAIAHKRAHKHDHDKHADHDDDAPITQPGKVIVLPLDKAQAAKIAAQQAARLAAMREAAKKKAAAREKARKAAAAKATAAKKAADKKSNPFADYKAPPAKVLAQAKMLFAANCASCHGPDGKGDGAAAKGFPANMKPRNYYTQEFKYGSKVMEIYKTLTKGAPPLMQSFAGLPSDQRLALAKYVRHIYVTARIKKK